MNRQTWELQVFRDINNSLCGTNNARTDFFRNTAAESLDSESLLQGNIFSDWQFTVSIIDDFYILKTNFFATVM